MADAITIKALQDASLDAKSLEEVVNGDDASQVTTRLGETYPSVKKAIKTMFENGGLPATPFTTRALMTASSLANDSYAMVTEDTEANNGLYVKTAGAWVKSAYDPLEQAKVYAALKANNAKDEAIAAALLEINSTVNELVTFSNNMFNDANKTIGRVISTNGSIDISSGHFVSDYMRVNGGETLYYTIADSRNILRIAYYDKDKNFLSILGGFSTTTGSFAIISNASYIRITGNVVGYNALQTMVSRNLITGYEPYTLPIATGVSLSTQSLNKIELIAKTQAADAVSGVIEDMLEVNRFVDNHIVLTDNLFNPNNVTTGKYVSATTGEVIDGSASGFISDFIRVEPSTTYSASASDRSQEMAGGFFSHIAYYDKDKKFIRRDGFNPLKGFVTNVVTLPNASFVRLGNTYQISAADRAFIKGADKISDFDDRVQINNVKMDSKFYDEWSKPYYYDTDFKGTYNCPRDLTTYQEIQSANSEDIYAAFDALVSTNPNYATKIRLLDSVLGREVSAYFFTAPKFSNTVNLIGEEDKLPTIFIASGVHGHEILPPTACYAFAKEMCDEWRQDETLSALRFNANFIIIPVSNPDGWVNNPSPPEGRSLRKNANGVDIARNFPCAAWGLYTDPESNTYSGPFAGSEPETKNIMRIIDEYKPDVFYDFHNFSLKGAADPMAWVVVPIGTSSLRITRTARALFSKQTRLIAKHHNNAPSSWKSGYSSLSSQGFPFEYAAEQGVTIACTFEINRSVPDWDGDGVYNSDFDEVHSKIAFNTLVNWITTCLDEIGQRF